jgi:hypothetical protein
MAAEYRKLAGQEMRVSDVEREATASELREHYAAGRLTRDELDARLDQALAAKTRRDLSAVMQDLPSLRPGGAPLPGAGQPSSGAGWTTGAGWGQTGQDADPGAGWGRTEAGQAIGSAISMLVGLGLVAFFAILAVGSFGIGGGRPIGIALILAAVAVLRRLVFGRRRLRPRRSRRF